MTEVLNLQSLRGIVGINGDVYYTKGHTNSGDGGGGVFMWRTNPIFTGTGTYNQDNNGTIIQAVIGGIPNDTGRWVRQYDGYINVLYFGAFGVGNPYNTEIQNAIDFAKLNASDVSNLKSSTVFMPNGSYVLENIILKSGVNILGESISNTIIYTKGEGTEGDYLFEIESGPVQINISGLNILGYEPLTGIVTNKGCFYFKAQPNIPNPIDPATHGGLWNSTIKNILIHKFYGNGIYLEGGVEGPEHNASLLPNQFNIFENVRVFKNNDSKFTKFSNALKMTGQNGQHTFINCQFDGHVYYLPNPENPKELIGYFDKWINVNIENITKDYLTSNVITFLNCTIQVADYGVRINYAENVTFDNCWFENLGVALTIIGDKERSKSINILNNRFANASGFGSLTAPNNIKDGQCVSVNKSVVNIYNNYVTASDPNGVSNDSAFVLGFPENFGINCYNNTFRDNSPKLSKTFGIMQSIYIDVNTIDCKSNKLIFINPTPDPNNPGHYLPSLPIKKIVSAINAGEIIVIRANGFDITFENTDNIFLTNRVTFSLAKAEIASFIKIDIGNNNETYQLLSFTKTTP
jgi:hypothetical protein